MKPHLKAVLCLKGDNGTAWYEYLIFPEIAFIYNQNFVSKQGNIAIVEQENKSNAPTDKAPIVSPWYPSDSAINLFFCGFPI